MSVTKAHIKESELRTHLKSLRTALELSKALAQEFGMAIPCTDDVEKKMRDSELALDAILFTVNGEDVRYCNYDF